MFTKPSVDSVISDFTKMIGKLRSVIQDQESTIAFANQEIEHLNDKKSAAVDELTRATNIINNLEKLVDGQ